MSSYTSYNGLFGAVPCPKPGIYPDMNEDEYRAWDAANYSTLKDLSGFYYCPAKAFTQKEPTSSMKLGTLFHEAMQGPIKHDMNLLPSTIGRRFGKKWEEFKALHPGNWMPQKEYDDATREIQKAEAMADAVRANPTYAGWVENSPHFEVAMVADIPVCDRFGEEHLFRCKCKADLVAGGGIIDYKSVQSSNPYDFFKDIAKWRYHVQAAFYPDIMQHALGRADECWFAFVTCESSAPHIVGLFDPKEGAASYDSAFARGRNAYQEALLRLPSLMEHGIENKYYCDTQKEPVCGVNLPSWAD